MEKKIIVCLCESFDVPGRLIFKESHKLQSFVFCASSALCILWTRTYWTASTLPAIFTFANA